MPLKYARRFASRLAPSPPQPNLNDLKLLSGSALAHLHRVHPPASLQEAEFRVFSQFGDDGLIQYLVRALAPTERSFVEFGVESYQEANTRFLLQHDNWRGLVMDGSAENIAQIRADNISWRHELHSVCAFINRDNINQLIADAGFEGALGLLSIDIDGVDWWVWERLECVQPLIVVAEYNSVFGAEAAVTVPYRADFQRAKAHHSNLYWGCSLRALCVLAERKGYAFVGCNKAGNNAYFVRQDSLGPLSPVDPIEGYVESRFRESRDAEGKLTFLSGAARRSLIAHLEVWDVEASRTTQVGAP